jgi:hypothetical protein
MTSIKKSKGCYLNKTGGIFPEVFCSLNVGPDKEAIPSGSSLGQQPGTAARDSSL